MVNVLGLDLEVAGHHIDALLHVSKDLVRELSGSGVQGLRSWRRAAAYMLQILVVTVSEEVVEHPLERAPP